MCEKKRTPYLSFAAVIAVLAMFLLLISSYPTSAKGPARSGEKSDRTDERSAKEDRSERDRSERNRSERNRSETRSRREEARSSRETSRPPAAANRPDRDKARNTGRDRSTGRDKGLLNSRDRDSAKERGRDRANLETMPRLRNRGPSDSRRETMREFPNVPPTRGQVRKDYANLGQIWRQRSERKGSYSDRYRRDHDRRDTIVIFHGRYPYYAYDWSPGYYYPSVYCYYYGHFPPYIPASRVVYLSRRPLSSYAYADLPDVILRYDPDYDDDYYMSGGLHKQLSIALRNIRRGWETEDADLIMRHVERGLYVDVFMSGDYEYSIDWKDYYDMTYDAMSSLETVDFDFYRVSERDNREVVAYGKHTYYDDYDDDGRYYDDNHFKKTVYMSYTLKQKGSHWYITEVSPSTHKLY